MRLDAILEGFWLSRRRGLSENTHRDYGLTFRRLMEQLGAGAEFEEISGKDLNGFMNYLADDLGLSKKTQLNNWIALSALWTWAEKEVGTKHIVHLYVERPRPKAKAIVPLTEQEVRLMLFGCDHTNGWDTSKGERTLSKRPTALRDRAILLVLLETGLRVSELCDLQIQDYNRKRGQLFVARGKGDKERAVYMGDVARKALWHYQTKKRKDAKLADALFASQSGKPLRRDNLQKLVKRIGERVGVRGVYPHKFRHTFAINFLRNGGNLFALQAALGHANLDTVKIYAKLAETDLEEASKRASVADGWKL